MSKLSLELPDDYPETAPANIAAQIANTMQETSKPRSLEQLKKVHKYVLAQIDKAVNAALQEQPEPPQPVLQVFNQSQAPIPFNSRQSGAGHLPPNQGLTVAGGIQMGNQALDFDALGHNTETGNVVVEQVSLPYRHGVSILAVTAAPVVDQPSNLPPPEYNV